MISSSPIRPMSTPRLWPPFRPNTPPSREWRMRAGADGLDIVRRILREATEHLTPEGALVCEIGRGRDLILRDFPDLPFVWLDTEESEGEVFLLRASDFSPPQRRPKRRR